MKILNFGSLNLDYVYRMHHFIRPGETAPALTRSVVCGGKGLNQSIALARSGASVFHAGNIGAADGEPLRQMLRDNGVDVRYLRERNVPGGHTIIQVNDEGENAIILYPGANAMTDEAQIEETLADFGAGDLLVLQNEISCIPELMRAARARGMQIAMNPSPVDGTEEYPLELLDFLFVNQSEAAHFAGCDPANAVDALRSVFPSVNLIITCGSRGAYFLDAAGRQVFEPAVPVTPLDTTAAGDTFMGYFLGRWAAGETPERCMHLAACAAALAVTRPGAAPSIPLLQEVEQFAAQA